MIEQKPISELLSETVLKAVADYEVFESHVIVLHCTEHEAKDIADYVGSKMETHCDYVGEVTAGDLLFDKAN